MARNMASSCQTFVLCVLLSCAMVARNLLLMCPYFGCYSRTVTPHKLIKRAPQPHALPYNTKATNSQAFILLLLNYTLFLFIMAQVLIFSFSCFLQTPFSPCFLMHMFMLVWLYFCII